ncbi:MAG: YadA-like family protein, partial [Xanthobacteraceae bacterium]
VVDTQNFCRTAPLFVRMNAFASASEVQANSAQIATLNGQVQTINSQLAQIQTISRQMAQVQAINGQIAEINRQISQSFEMVAVAAALKDAIPNPGDRFAFRINAAAFEGYAAGAIGVSYNITESARISFNYGQGQSRAIVSGGMNFSFR